MAARLYERLRSERSVLIGLVLGAIVVAIMVPAAACRDDVQGSGRAVTERRDVASFTELRIRGAITAEVRIGEPQSVEVSGDDNVVRVIKTEVRDDRLTIEPERSYNSDAPLRVAIVVPRLEAVEASGASTIAIAGVSADALRVRASGASTVRAGGRVGRVTADATGASRIRIEDLSAQTADVAASGASSIDLTVSETLDGSASGASTVRYSGSPEVKVRTSGASSVRSR